jgi:hypothetical protein
MLADRCVAATMGHLFQPENQIPASVFHAAQAFAYRGGKVQESARGDRSSEGSHARSERLRCRTCHQPTPCDRVMRSAPATGGVLGPPTIYNPSTPTDVRFRGQATAGVLLRGPERISAETAEVAGFGQHEIHDCRQSANSTKSKADPQRPILRAAHLCQVVRVL